MGHPGRLNSTCEPLQYLRMGRYLDASGWMASATGYGRRAYRAYSPHPLATWVPTLSDEAYAAITAADNALAATLAASKTDMSGALSEWMMARDESIRSSVMEGVASTGTGLDWARYMDQAGRPVSDENDALTLGAAKQVSAAVDLGKKMRSGETVQTEDILDIHRLLFAGTRDRDMGGVLRDGPIWVGPAGCLAEEATFVPPPAEQVPELMDDLVAYLNASRHPPVLKAAAVHAQFETIHPFDDGNGRAGRALIHTVLVSSGRTDSAVPVSGLLDRSRNRYYEALNATHAECEPDDTAVRSDAMHDWLLMFSDACVDASRQADSITRDVDSIVAGWRKSVGRRRGSAAVHLMEMLPSMPVLDADMAAKKLDVTEKTARAALRSLETAGVVKSTGGHRNKRYIVPDMVGVLRRMTPDGGMPQRRIPPASTGFLLPAQTAATGFPPPERPACPHIGPRSHKRCILPRGHAGQHRYRSG